MKKSIVNIFDYTDYRKFLRDRSTYLKSIDAPVSYRHIAEVAGFKSPGFITQILDGRCGLPERFIEKIASTFQLKKREAKYFELMVRYNQAENHDEKKAFFRKMTAFKKGRVRTLEPDAYDFYDKWYYSAIRAVLNYHQFTGDYGALAKMVVPRITAAEARKAVAVLERLGLIERRDGRYILTNNHLTTGPQADAVVINNFVVNTLDIAKEALYSFPRNDRNFSALTLSVSRKGYDRLRDKIEALRAEMIAIVKDDTDIDRVVQVNFQLFPLTDVSAKDGGRV